MAELAIPLVVLGAMYVISNQDKTVENYEDMGKPANYLPNTNIPPKNFPVLAPVNDSNVKKYPNPNQATDKYFNQDVYKKTVAQKSDWGVGQFIDPEITSLTGTPIATEDFKHNNMVPFFGAKVKGATIDATTSEAILDTMTGAGSQVISKRETAPLFKPQKDVQWSNGVPNANDFYQSRVNPGTRMANIKPWQEQQVGPGLNKGYITQGSGGFNAGMEARDCWLPRNVDQLRTKTNPKVTYGMQGHEGPAISHVKNSASTQTQGAVEKYLPDTYYTVGPERWFTTTGLEKGERARGIEILQDVNRPSTTVSYYGTGGDQAEGSYIPGHYQSAHRTAEQSGEIANPSAVGQNQPTDADFGIKSYNNLPNNRNTTRQADEYGIVGGIMKAIIAPIFDTLRPTRKENTIGNIRPNGNVGLVSGETQPVYNPADRTRTTMRETLVGKLDCNHLNVENQGEGGYTVSQQHPVTNQRDTTNCSYAGDPGAPIGVRTYNAAYNQHNNVNKGYKNHPNQGGLDLFNPDEGKTCISRRDLCSDRGPIVVGGPSIIPSLDSYGKINTPQYYNECQSCDRIQPDILDAFKQNPYTQSLQSWASS